MRIAPYLLLLVAVSAGANTTLFSVENGETSVYFDVMFFEEDGLRCLNDSDMTNNTGLVIKAGTNRSVGMTSFAQSSGKILTITTIDTYQSMAADEVRVRQRAANSCWYQIQLPDAFFSVADASSLYVEWTDGGTAMLDGGVRIGLDAVSEAAFVSGLFGQDLSGFTTAGTFGNQVGAQISAIKSDTTSLGANLSVIQTRTEAIALAGGEIETVTSQTEVIPDESSQPSFDDAYVGDFMCVTDVGGSDETYCALILGYVANTGEFTIQSGAIPFTIDEGHRYYIRAGGANTEAMNAAPVCGNGQPGTPWTGC